MRVKIEYFVDRPPPEALEVRSDLDSPREVRSDGTADCDALQQWLGHKAKYDYQLVAVTDGWWVFTRGR